jgi:hypothetical protein
VTIPTFRGKGTADAGSYDTCAGSWETTVTLPATIEAGDILVILAACNTFSGTVDSINTPSGWNLGDSSGVGGVFASSYFYKVASGTEDGSTVTIDGMFTGFFCQPASQSYCFKDSGTGGFHAVGGKSDGTGTSLTIPSVTTTEANELAVALLCISQSTTLGDSSGETGGNYTEVAAEDAPTGITLQCQSAAMASAGTITGGTATAGASGTWMVFSFALKEITSSIPNKLVRGNFAVKRASSF